MSIYEQLEPGDFKKSTKKRLPICFCLDVSGSMIAPTADNRTRMDELNDAFSKFIETMKNSPEVSASADIGIVTFGGDVRIAQQFIPVSNLNHSPINVNIKSLTPLGEAIQLSLKLLEVRKNAYKQRGIKYYQPWLVVLTDGEPEGKNAKKSMEEAISLTTKLEKENKLVVFNVGIGEDANLDELKKLSVKRNEPISVTETRLDELFTFLGASSESVIGGDDIDNIYNNKPLTKGREIKYEDWVK